VEKTLVGACLELAVNPYPTETSMRFGSCEENCCGEVVGEAWKMDVERW